MSNCTDDENIKPQVSSEQAINLADKLFGLQVTSLTELLAYDDRNFLLIVSKSTNPNISQVSPHGYILKFINANDSEDGNFFEAQTQTLLILQEKLLPAPIPVKTVSGFYQVLEELPFKNKTRKHLVRLFEYLPGKVLKSVPGSLDLYFQVGVWIAQFDLALKGFQHAGIEQHNTMWHMNFIPNLPSYVHHVQDATRRRLVEEVLEDFNRTIVPAMHHLERGVIHGDCNEHNLLVDSTIDGDYNMAAILDLGDINIGFYLYEVAATVAYMMLDGLRSHMDHFMCGRATLDGYRSVRPLSTLEKSLLKTAVCARICQSLVLGLYTYSLQPDNHYVLDTQTNGWAVLASLWHTPDSQLAKMWSLES